MPIEEKVKLGKEIIYGAVMMGSNSMFMQAIAVSSIMRLKEFNEPENTIAEVLSLGTDEVLIEEFKKSLIEAFNDDEMAKSFKERHANMVKTNKVLAKMVNADVDNLGIRPYNVILGTALIEAGEEICKGVK
jgi:molybdopterin-guanine dinucleotide biosynthesis protein